LPDELLGFGVVVILEHVEDSARVGIEIVAPLHGVVTEGYDHRFQIDVHGFIASFAFVASIAVVWVPIGFSRASRVVRSVLGLRLVKS
jgi:hypothetical protein